MLQNIVSLYSLISMLRWSKNDWFSGCNGEDINLQVITIIWKAESENCENKLYSTNRFKYIKFRSAVEQKQHAQALSSSDCFWGHALWLKINNILMLLRLMIRRKLITSETNTRLFSVSVISYSTSKTEPKADPKYNTIFVKSPVSVGRNT